MQARSPGCRPSRNCHRMERCSLLRRAPVRPPVTSHDSCELRASVFSLAILCAPDSFFDRRNRREERGMSAQLSGAALMLAVSTAIFSRQARGTWSVPMLASESFGVRRSERYGGREERWCASASDRHGGWTWSPSLRPCLSTWPADRALAQLRIGCCFPCFRPALCKARRGALVAGERS